MEVDIDDELAHGMVRGFDLKSHSSWGVVRRRGNEGKVATAGLICGADPKANQLRNNITTTKIAVPVHRPS